MTTEPLSIPISPHRVDIPRSDLRRMHQLARTLFRLSLKQNYRQRVLPELPEVARFDPGHASVMMGYDFHLGPDGPRLIEVNTNAGGAFVAWESQRRDLQGGNQAEPDERFQQRLLFSFTREWRDFSANKRPLQTLVIIDEKPESQPLYPEMVSCKNWLADNGIDTRIADPAELEASAEGVFHEGTHIDLIYNRHCDFYLEEAVMAGLRSAYLAGSVCLSPNPFSYGLLADKRRMILWSDADALKSLDLPKSYSDSLLELVPRSRLLAALDPVQVWDERAGLVFKPVARFGGRGVLTGKSITRKRFAEMEPETTLVQNLIPPSKISDSEGRSFKVDLRLFVYRDHLLGVGARLYQGQLTNLRTPGGGFAPVRIVRWSC